MITILIRSTFRQPSSRDFSTTCRKFTLPNLSPYDVNLILREHEYTHNFTEDNPIRGYDSNQLGSNKPMEDSRTEGSFIHKNGFICGVFDGHAGPSCSQVISKRLLRYIAAGVVDRNVLADELSKGCNSQSFLKCHNDKVDFVKEIKALYEESFLRYAKEISSQTTGRVDAIENAFLRLDDDLSDEALNHTDARTMSVAMSGAVTCVALVEDRDLYIANTGDCAAVLGVQTDTGWVAKRLTKEHNTENIQEVNRILNEHPKSERETVIRADRLLGQLAPLRALGDFRYKWSDEIMQKYVVPAFGEMCVPPHYYTPPYLTGRPEITHHILNPADKFLVVASDGLWDFLSYSKVVELVGEHLTSKKILEPLRLPQGNVTLGEISNILADRKAGRKRKPMDQNSATHLIRNALGGTEYGIEHSKLSHLLSLPQEAVRLFRDDITITVIYFNSDYIQNCS